MTDNLPLIPEKSATCGDVRGVLRGVLRELGARAHESLPLLEDATWKGKYSAECQKLSRCDAELRQEYAKRLSRSPLPNIYRICEARASSEPSERNDCDVQLKRRHLAPGVRQHASPDSCLWVRSMRCPSARSMRGAAGRGAAPLSPRPLPPAPPDHLSLSSISIGSAHAPATPPPPPAPPDRPLPAHVLCVPPSLEFVNFVIGQEYKQTVRLVNLSTAALRLAVRPPARRELRVSAGARGQRLTAGAAALLRVSFTPRDARTLHADLLVRVSTGRPLLIPIKCYMQPPVLEVLMPLEPTLSLTCSPEMCAASTTVGACSIVGGDVLELGARLLGDVHRVSLLLLCRAEHASFFVLTEDSWINYTLEGITSGGVVVSGSFTWWPAWWRGGGGVRGSAGCRARRPGLHAAALRVLASTAAVRPLCLLADSLYYRRDHITVQAHEKDYDICSEDDSGCEYYVHLGVAFPGRGLSTTVQLVNHSPVSYSYYWSVRAWGVCTCRGEDCEGATRRSQGAAQEVTSLDDHNVVGGLRVEPTSGRLPPRSSCSLHVCAPDVGAQLGVQRATLMLILKDVPKESFPPGYDPMVISCRVVDSEPMPGIEIEEREVCDVVCCEMEVWWEVAPPRFVLDPPLLRLPHSPRMKQVPVTVRATQLFGREPIIADWRLAPGLLPPAPPAARLTPAQSLATEILVPLLIPSDEETVYNNMDVIELVGRGGEWRACCVVERAAERRGPRLAPPARWLGVVPPAARQEADLVLTNDTYQHMQWSCAAVRWCGDTAGSPRCEGRAPCPRCHVRSCACTLLSPAAGALPHGDSDDIRFAVDAPKGDGCVLTLVTGQRAARDDVNRAAPGGDCGRAALVAFRVLAPRLFIRVLQCLGDHKPGKNCECCALDVCIAGGAALVRPRVALAAGGAACCRLLLANAAPVATVLVWDPPLNTDEPLLVSFFPNEVVVGPYERVEIQVRLEAVRVSPRRVLVRRARVLHAPAPLYLIIDTDIAGVEVTVELPLGADADADGAALLRRSQVISTRYERHVSPSKVLLQKQPPAGHRPPVGGDAFEVFEREQIEYIKKLARCRCSGIPPRDLPGPKQFSSRPAREPLCLQFAELPLRTVRRRTVVLRNECALAARWTARVRRWPRTSTHTLAVDKWAADVRDPGVAIEVSPSSGELLAGRGRGCGQGTGGAGGHVARLVVEVYADCAGLYHDQLLIQIEHVAPVVVDVWLHAVGAPLVLLSATAPAPAPAPAPSPALWISPADEQRVVRARNATRSRLLVRASLLRDHEDERDREVLRVYLRLQDAPPAPHATPAPPANASHSSLQGEVSESSSSLEPEPISVDLFLTADFGPQRLTPYTVEPESCILEVGADLCLQVSKCDELKDQLPTDAVLMLCCEILDRAGDGWFRPPPPPQTVSLRRAPRRPRLQLSTCEVRVTVCALTLPFNDVLRVRKRFHVMNVGDGPVSACAFVRRPWALVLGGAGQGPRACGARGAARLEEVPLALPPRSSTEMCVEVCIPRQAATPPPLAEPLPHGRHYHERTVTTTPFLIRDDEDVHAKMKLVLEVEYPVVTVQPDVIDFRFVTDDDTKKTYFTVTHSSRTQTLDLSTEWRGPAGVQLRPPRLMVPPGAACRVYLQYTAKWCGAPVEGRAVVAARGAAWCGAAVAWRAAPVRDRPAHHADDHSLLPPHASYAS